MFIVVSIDSVMYAGAVGPALGFFVCKSAGDAVNPISTFSTPKDGLVIFIWLVAGKLAIVLWVLSGERF